MASRKLKLKKKKPDIDFFDSLVKNAIDFMEQSIEELENNPKASVIDFQAAIELFLKARLGKEHWSLIVYDPSKADREKFKEGDFQSVSMKEAVKRLKNIVGVRPRNIDHPCFDTLREHRNRLIHFFDLAYDKPDDKAIQQVVKEECRSWYFVHQWLSIQWKVTFKDYQPQVEKLHKKMIKQRQFLKAKYEQIRPTLDNEKKKGVKFKKCNSCGFQSVERENVIGPLHISYCRVCEMKLRYLIVSCPDCGQPIYIEELGEGECQNPDCHKEIKMEELIGIHTKWGTYKDEMIEPSNAYCTWCEYVENKTVVEVEPGEHLCMNCLETFNDEEILQCESCGEKNAGDMEASYLNGCVFCFGFGYSDD